MKLSHQCSNTNRGLTTLRRTSRLGTLLSPICRLRIQKIRVGFGRGARKCNIQSLLMRISGGAWWRLDFEGDKTFLDFDFDFLHLPSSTLTPSFCHIGFRMLIYLPCNAYLSPVDWNHMHDEVIYKRSKKTDDCGA